jgi:hypothetical protein
MSGEIKDDRSVMQKKKKRVLYCKGSLRKQCIIKLKTQASVLIQCWLARSYWMSTRFKPSRNCD